MTLASLPPRRGYHTAGVGKWHLGLRWAAKPGATPDGMTNHGECRRRRIDYAQPIADGRTHHGFAEDFGLPASLDMRDYVIVRWPGVVAPGGSSRAVVGLVDVLATVAEAVGEPLACGVAEDSISFLPALRRPDAPFDRRSALVVQSGDGSLAIREGRWGSAPKRASCSRSSGYYFAGPWITAFIRSRQVATAFQAASSARSGSNRVESKST